MTLLQHHELYPARLLCVQDFPGKNTTVGHHCLLQGFFSNQESNLHVLHWQEDSLPLSHLGNLSRHGLGAYIILCVYVSGSVMSDSLWSYDHKEDPPGSSAHRILQARIQEWVAIPFSKGSSWLWDQTQDSHTAGRFFNVRATKEAKLKGQAHPKFEFRTLAHKMRIAPLNQRADTHYIIIFLITLEVLSLVYSSFILLRMQLKRVNITKIVEKVILASIPQER